MPKPPPSVRAAGSAATRTHERAARQPKTEAQKARGRRRSRVLIAMLGSSFALVALFAGLFPTRAVLAQRSDIAAAQAELDRIAAGNAVLQERIDALGTDAEIERIARRDYNLVYPGEEAYALLPAAGGGKWTIFRGEPAP
jgi:cell division protein FtsB